MGKALGSVPSTEYTFVCAIVIITAQGCCEDCVYAKCFAQCLAHSRCSVNTREEPKEAEEASGQQENGRDRAAEPPWEHPQGPGVLLVSQAPSPSDLIESLLC